MIKLIFLVGLAMLGGTYTVLRSEAFTGIVAFAALLYGLSFALLPFLWVVQVTGTAAFVQNLWLNMGGIENPGEMVQDCGQHNENLLLGLIGLSLTFVLIFVCMGGGTLMLLFGLPIGTVVFLVGCIAYPFTGEDTLLLGTKILSVAVSGIVLAGGGDKCNPLHLGTSVLLARTQGGQKCPPANNSTYY